MRTANQNRPDHVDSEIPIVQNPFPLPVTVLITVMSCVLARGMPKLKSEMSQDCKPRKLLICGLIVE
jgi:hypothetical protein